MKKLVSLILFVFAFAAIGNAQRIDIEQKIKDKVIDRADQHTDEAIDKGLDAIEEGISDAATDEEEASSDSEEQSDEESSDEEPAAKKTSTNKPQSTASDEPKLQSATKYDFVPGDKVILYEDFSQDAVGDFPALWTTNGSGEIRTLNKFPGNWLYMNSEGSSYCLMKDLTMPDNFIFEFDVVPVPLEEDGLYSGLYISLYQGEGEFLDDAIYPGFNGVNINMDQHNWNVVSYKESAGYTQEGSTEIALTDINKMNHVIVWVQKRRLRIYHKGQKALDLPTILYPDVKYNRIRFSLWGNEGTSFITNLRVTSAAPDMRSKLLTEGKIVSYGIYFDVNKDVVKPESNGTLKGIAAVLTENPDVKIKIVGHTDSDGVDAANMDLSKRRAASVKNELVKMGIDASRIETDGKGETVPVAPNDNSANKAMNRRVEFIKM